MLTPFSTLLQLPAPQKQTCGVKRQTACKVKRRQPVISAGAESPTRFFWRLDNMNPNRLFVGNLSYQTIENELQEYFSQAGPVTSVNLMLDKFTGKSRGFAFIEYATPAEAEKAVEVFHGKEFHGRALTVNIAKPREERSERPPRREGGFRSGPRDGGRRERY
jgi:RNA recognition motif-containing protein